MAYDDEPILPSFRDEIDVGTPQPNATKDCSAHSTSGTQSTETSDATRDTLPKAASQHLHTAANHDDPHQWPPPQHGQIEGALFGRYNSAQASLWASLEAFVTTDQTNVSANESDDTPQVDEISCTTAQQIAHASV
jgi:hypothetical protein